MRASSSTPTGPIRSIRPGPSPSEAPRASLEATQQRAAEGELFVLEPDAVHTGMAAVPEGWTYKVLYIEPTIVHEWAEHDGSPPRAARWVVFRDVALRGALERPPSAGVRAGRQSRHRGGGARSRRWPASPSAPRTVGARPSHAEHAAVRRARDHLRERWDERVSLAELSGVAGLSRYELVRRFRDQTDITPHAFQTNLRIAQARRLLSAGVAPVEVAAECGFADQPHLSRVFKRAVGVSPARYARAQ